MPVREKKASDMIWKIRQDSDRVCHVEAIIHKFTNKATVGRRTQVVGSVSGHGPDSQGDKTGAKGLVQQRRKGEANVKENGPYPPPVFRTTMLPSARIICRVSYYYYSLPDLALPESHL